MNETPTTFHQAAIMAATKIPQSTMSFIVICCICFHLASSLASTAISVSPGDIPIVTDSNTDQPPTTQPHNVVVTSDIPFGSTYQPITTQEPTTNGPEEQKKTPKTGIEPGWIVLIVVVSFILIIVLFYFAKKYFEKQQALGIINDRISKANRGNSEYEDPENPIVSSSSSDEPETSSVARSAGLASQSYDEEITPHTPETKQDVSGFP